MGRLTGRAVAAAAAVALGATLIVAATASAASRNWTPCGTAAAKVAAGQALLPERMDADPRLRRIFGDQAPSSVLKISRSLCADYDGDGDRDRAVLYTCCTVSSPSPIAILRNDGGGGHTIVFARLHDAVLTLRTAGRDLVEREPRYAPTDANCCPSQVRERRIHWNGRRFATTVRIRKAQRASLTRSTASTPCARHPNRGATWPVSVGCCRKASFHCNDG